MWGSDSELNRFRLAVFYRRCYLSKSWLFKRIISKWHLAPSSLRELYVYLCSKIPRGAVADEYWEVFRLQLPEVGSRMHQFVIFVTEVTLPGFIGGELMKWLRVYEMFTLAMCNDCATSNTAAGVVFIRVAVACRPSSSSSSSHMAVERYNDSCWPTTWYLSALQWKSGTSPFLPPSPIADADPTGRGRADCLFWDAWCEAVAWGLSHEGMRGISDVRISVLHSIQAFA